MEENRQTGLSRWWRVAGGLSMNLALGTLYAWSVFVAPLEAQFGWKRADTSMVFTIAVSVFALSFVVAGRIQDKFGPFYCSLAGGILVSLGFFLCAYTTSLSYLFVCFGVIGGLGQRIRLRHADSGDGQVVSRQARPGGGTGGGRIWRRVGDLRPAVATGADPALRAGGHVSDSRRGIFRDDHDRAPCC